MRKTLTPTDKQREVGALWKEHGGLILNGQVGSGKTLAAVEGFRTLETEVNLVIAPLHTYSSWKSTVENQLGETLRFIDKKKAGQEADTDLRKGVPGFYFIGRERFRQYNFRRFPIDAVVLDEAHFVGNRNSKSFKVGKSLKNVPYKLAMSGTISGNKFEGMYGVSKVTFPDDVDNSFWRWVSEWCHTEYSPFTYQEIVGEKNPGEFVKSLPAYMFMESPYQEEPITTFIDVDLTPTQRKIYKTLEEESILFMEENPTFVDLPATLYTRLLQTVLAVPEIHTWIDDEGKERSTATFPENAKSTKIDIFLDLLKDIDEDEPIVVFSHSKIFIELLSKRLNEKGYPTEVFDSKRTDELIEGFGKDFRILAGTQAAMGEGLNGLQHKSHYEVIFSLSDNRIMNKQARGRLSRRGQEKQVYTYIIRANDTVETHKQHPRLKSGEELLEQSFQLDMESNEV